MECRRRDRELEIQKAVDQWYMAYKKKLQIFVSTNVSNQYVADDIVQDVFLELLRKYDSFENHPNQVGWLYRTASYKIREYERRMRIRNEVTIEEKMQEVCGSDKGYQEIEFKLLIKRILSDEECLRYVRYYIWGYSVEELASLEGVSENNVRVRLSRLRKKIVDNAGLLLVIITFTGAWLYW